MISVISVQYGGAGGVVCRCLEQRVSGNSKGFEYPLYLL